MRLRLTLIQKYTLVSALCVLALVLGLGTVITRQLTETLSLVAGAGESIARPTHTRLRSGPTRVGGVARNR
ncbi:MAG: hypothetical protein HY725_09670 [Candidatus Rokubacteria bacterium]|nr:hypothetical protein [Candidatus Rokubacteria bacterium]